MTAAGFAFKSMYDLQSGQLAEVKTSLQKAGDELQKVNLAIARMEEKTASLERTVYRQKAEAAGLKDPKIITVGSNEKTTLQASTGKKNGQSTIELSNLKYDQDTHALRFIASLVKSGIELKKNTYKLDMSPRHTVNIGALFASSLVLDAVGAGGLASGLYLALLNEPSPDTPAVVGIGLMEPSTEPLPRSQ